MAKKKEHRLPKIENAFRLDDIKPVHKTDINIENNIPSDAPKEMVWLAGSIMFAKVLCYILEEGEGCVLNVELPPEAGTVFSTKKICVFKQSNNICIASLENEDDFVEGEFIMMEPTDDEGDEDDD